MRGRPTQQAYNAIQAMLNAGFARNEFKVTTEQKWYKEEDGRSEYEWGAAKIFIKAPVARAEELTPAMLEAGLFVQHFYYEGRLLTVIASQDYEKRGRLEIHK